MQPGSSGSWKVKSEGGARRIGALFAKKSEAIGFAKDRAKKDPVGLVKIQNREGVFEREFTYGKVRPRSRKR